MHEKVVKFEGLWKVIVTLGANKTRVTLPKELSAITISVWTAEL